MEAVGGRQLLREELDLLFKVADAEDVVGEEGAPRIVGSNAFEDLTIRANLGFALLGLGLFRNVEQRIEQVDQLGRGVVVDGRAPQRVAHMVEVGLHLVSTGAQASD